MIEAVVIVTAMHLVKYVIIGTMIDKGVRKTVKELKNNGI